MNELTDLEQQLTDALQTRAASASPPPDAWGRLVAKISNSPTNIPATSDERADVLAPVEVLLDIPDERPVRRWPIVVLGAAAAVLVVAFFVSGGGRTDEELIVTHESEQSLTWSLIEGIVPFDVVSDGESFFALVEGDNGSELWVSNDGTEWRPVKEVPFSHIDAVLDGKVLSMEADDFPIPPSPASFTIHVVDRDGTHNESTTTLSIPEPQAALVSSISADANFLGPDGLVITGSYRLAHDLVKAAGLGIPLEDIAALRGIDDPDSTAGVWANLLGMSVFEFEEETDLHDMARRIGLTEEPTGIVGVDLPIPFQISSVDGAVWQRADPQVRQFQAVSGTASGLIGAIGLDRFDVMIAASTDGIDWIEVTDRATGQTLPGGGILTPSRNFAASASSYSLYLSSSGVWTVNTEGATQIVIEGTELTNFDFSGMDRGNSIESVTAGEAGIAYLSGFTAGSGPNRDPAGPTAIVVSTDRETWTTSALPSDLIGPDDDFTRHRISIGAAGLVVWGDAGAWYAQLNT